MYDVIIREYTIIYIQLPSVSILSVLCDMETDLSKKADHVDKILVW